MIPTCQKQLTDNNPTSTCSSSTQGSLNNTENPDQKPAITQGRKRSHQMSSSDDEEENTDDQSMDDHESTRPTSNTQSRDHDDRVELDRALLEETLRVNPFGASHGTKKHAWIKVADNVKRKGIHSTTSMTGVYVRNRVHYLISTRRQADDTHVEQMRQRVIEAVRAYIHTS